MRSWGASLESGKGTHEDQQTLAAVWTGMPRSEQLTRGGGRMGLRGRGGWRLIGCMSPQPELQLVQEGTMDRTPQPIVADFVEALGHHMRQKAADALEAGKVMVFQRWSWAS